MTLSINNLCFNYIKNKVLQDISFSLKEGECLAVLGTNGAGKSTLLKCIPKILKPMKGTVAIDNFDLNKMSRLKVAQKIGYMSQHNQISKITVFDSVLIGRKPYIKWDTTQKDLKIVEKVLKTLDLENYALRYTDELSGGEYQKVVIARALAQEPDILIFDEPTNNLDLKNQLEIIDTIKAVVKNNEISAIVTIHDLNLALRMADKFLFLKDGKVFAYGGMEVVNPENINAVYSVKVSVEKVNNNVMVVPI